MPKKRKVEESVDVAIDEVVRLLVIQKPEQDIIDVLVDEGLTNLKAQKIVKAARKKIAETSIPSRKELVTLNLLLFEQALEEKALGVAQKALQELGKLGRIEHAIDADLPLFDKSNPEPFFSALSVALKNNGISPAMLASLSRFINAANAEGQKAEEETQDPITAVPEDATEAARCVLRLLKADG